MAGLKVERIKPGMENYPEQMLWNLWGFPDGSVVKNPPTNAGDMGSIPGSGSCPWRRKWLPNAVFLPGESHGQSNLFSPWGRKGSFMTEGQNSNTSRPERNPPWGGDGMCPVLLSQYP